MAVALSFALTDFDSGAVTWYLRPYRNGDWVKVEDNYGEVESHDCVVNQIGKGLASIVLVGDSFTEAEGA